jgi:hypothetical protein
LGHEIFRAEKLAERRRAHSAIHARPEVEEHHAGHVLDALGPVVKHVNPVELRVVVSAVLAIAADAVLVAHQLSKLGAHLLTTLAHFHVHNL